MRLVLLGITLCLTAAACSADEGPAAETVEASPSSPPTSAAAVPGETPADGANPEPSTTPTTGAPSAESPSTIPPGASLTSDGYVIPAAPEVPTGPAGAELAANLETLFLALEENRLDSAALLDSADHGDPRTAWLYVDILRFVGSFEQAQYPVAAFETATGVTLPAPAFGGGWKTAVDFLIAWDLPTLPDYAEYKRRLFTAIEPGWAPFFEDPGASIDWRFVGWGGVFIDDRPLGVVDGCPRGCIPALDDPAVTDAAGGDWYDDDAIVFGVTVNGESRAYPKHQMETHEMVNDTLGGRRLGIPYCTLCGSAQAYFTDSVPAGTAVPVLRTSGLLSRSNKVMYDLVTRSLFDTFTGEAVSGPLREARIRLDQVTVVASTWGAWKEAHPDTTIVAEDGGIDFVYRLDPLGGRDDGGPIFPIGDFDERLAVHEIVIGVEFGDGRVVAFPKRAAVEVLQAGGSVIFEDVQVELAGTGLVASTTDGAELVAHEAFWFAWSQFWPATELWTP